MRSADRQTASSRKIPAGSWGIWVSVGFVLFVLTAAVRVCFGGELSWKLLHVMSDAATLPGVLLTGMGLLGRIAQSGAYDMFGYTAHAFRHLFRSARDGAHMTYADYRHHRREASRRRSAVVPVGALFLAVGTVMGLLCGR